MNVWLLDPGAMTPYYDISLTQALRAAGIAARLMTSRYLYEDQVPQAEQVAEYRFFRATAGWSKLLRRSAGLRWAARLAQYPLDWLRLYREFASQPPDLLHMQWAWLPPLDQATLGLMSRRVPLVLTVHDVLPRAAAMTRLADMRPIYRLADWFIVHAEENRRSLIARGGVNPGRVSVVPMGPSLEDQPLVERAEARQRLGLPADASVILFFGGIKPYKGLTDLLQAFQILRQQTPTTHLLIAGTVEGSAQPYHDEIDRLGIRDRVTFHVGFIPSMEVPAYFGASDIVCLPYREASQSAALLLAYRFAQPVVVTDVGALTESVDEGKNGFIVPPADPVALAQALTNVLADPALRKKMGEHSRRLAETRFGWPQAAQQTLQVYELARSYRASLRRTATKTHD